MQKEVRYLRSWGKETADTLTVIFVSATVTLTSSDGNKSGTVLLNTIERHVCVQHWTGVTSSTTGILHKHSRLTIYWIYCTIYEWEKQCNTELMNISKLLTALLLHTVDEAILGIGGFHLAKFKQRQLNHKAKIHIQFSITNMLLCCWSNNPNKRVHFDWGVEPELQECWCT